MSTVGKSIETEQISGCQDLGVVGRKWQVTDDRYMVSLGDNEKALKLIASSGNTTEHC